MALLVAEFPVKAAEETNCTQLTVKRIFASEEFGGGILRALARRQLRIHDVRGLQVARWWT